MQQKRILKVLLFLEMLLESVWAPLDDFWSAQDSGVRGCSGSLEPEEEHVTEGGSCLWGCTRTLWNSREQKPQADCQVWHSASSFCSVCPPENTEWAELSGELLCSALLQKQTMEQLLEPLGWAGWKHLALLCPFPVPTIGRSGRSPWMFPVPTTSWGRAALPQKLIVLPARRQLPSALTQTAFGFCCCLDAWKSVDSLSCSICYSFGKMFNILQPEDRTKAGWGFC